MMDSDSGEFLPPPASSSADHRPLYEAKLIHQFDHRFSTFGGSTDGDRKAGRTRDCVDRSPATIVEARFYVPSGMLEDRLLQVGWENRWLLGFRCITNATNERTLIACLLPRVAASNQLPILSVEGGATAVASLCANLNAFVLDYITRQKVGGTQINLYNLQQLPVFPPSAYAGECTWLSQSALGAWCATHAAELTYTAWDLEAFGVDCGHAGPPFRWDEERRFLLRAELDAAFFHLYLGTPDEWEQDASSALKAKLPTPRHAVDHIMETFPIVKRKDIEEHGTYRTKDTILAIYDEMAEAIRTGRPYQTRLDPPPADPSCRHPESTRPSWAKPISWASDPRS
jgi:hypothetical protein